MEGDKNGGLGNLLTGTTHVASDTRMVGRAIRERWGLPPATRETIKQRLDAIVKKESVAVPTPFGSIQDESKADTNSIRAASVLVTMNAQDQADDHADDKNARLDAGQSTENVTMKMYGVDAPIDDV